MLGTLFALLLVNGASAQESAQSVEAKASTAVVAHVLDSLGNGRQILEPAPDPKFLLGPEFLWAGDDGLGGIVAHYNLWAGQRSVVFAEVSAFFRDADDPELAMISAGLGGRVLLPDDRTMVGLNAFYDGLQDESGFSYSQLGLGLEVARGPWTLRGNYYLPVGDTDRITKNKKRWTEKTRSDDGMTTTQFTELNIFGEFAMRGWDAELALQLIDTPGCVSALVAAGYYSMWEGDDDTQGVKLRAEARLGRYLVMGAEWRQNGNDIGQEWRVEAGLRFALGSVNGDAFSAEQNAAVRARAADAKAVYLVNAGGKDVREVNPALAMPVVHPVEAVPFAGAPGIFFGPVHRSPWPTVLNRGTERAWSKIISQSVNAKGSAPGSAAAPECYCGAPLSW